jgi:uncharacterized protein YxeA
MKKILASLLLLTVIATPAFAKVKHNRDPHYNNHHPHHTYQKANHVKHHHA